MHIQRRHALRHWEDLATNHPMKWHATLFCQQNSPRAPLDHGGPLSFSIIFDLVSILISLHLIILHKHYFILSN